MIASLFSGLGYAIGIVIAFAVIAIALLIIVGVAGWVLRAALRLLIDVFGGFVPGLRRWARRHDSDN